MANDQSDAPQEICRMPWFLVQIKSSHKADEAQQKNVKYCIIHSVDINDVDSSNMYVDSIVHFNQNHNALEGKIVMASEERAVVEQEMRKRTSATARHQPNAKFLLLQYTTRRNDLGYMLVPEKEVIWPTVLPPDVRDVVVNDVHEEQCIATILMMDNDRELLETKFQELKQHTLKKYLENTTVAEDGEWIWMQYICSPYTVAYAILNQRDNIWYEQNLYKDVVAYFKVEQNVHQAIILQRSDDAKVLLRKMNAMKESCLQLFVTAENKENVSADAAATANSAGARALSGAASMGNGVAFYGSNLNTNGLG